MKAEEIEGELNENEEEEEEEIQIQQQGHNKETLNIENIKTFEDFKNALIQMDDQRVIELCKKSEESIMKQAEILDDIENIKKTKQKEQIQYIQKIFQMVPQYNQKLFQILSMQQQIDNLMEMLRKKKRID